MSQYFAAFIFITYVFFFPDLAFGDSEISQSTPLHIEGGWAVVTVHLNKQPKPLRFIVDTAAGKTIISNKIAEALGLIPIGKDIVKGAVGAGDFQMAIVKFLELGQISRTEFPVVLTDMEMFTIDDVHYDGILGNDILRDYSYIFDVPANQLVLIDTDQLDTKTWNTCLPNGGGSNVEDELQGFAQVNLKLGKNTTIRAIIDTGAGRNIINWAAARALNLSEKSTELNVSKTLNGINKNVEAKSFETMINNLTFSKWDIPKFKTSISDLPVFEGFGLSNQPAAILGIEVLKMRPIGITRNAQSICLME